MAACDCTGITAGPPPPPAAPRTPRQGLRQQCGAAGSAVGSCSGLKVTRTCWTAEGRRDELAFGRVILGDGLGAGPLGARETNPGRAQWAPCSRFLPKEDGRDVSALRRGHQQGPRAGPTAAVAPAPPLGQLCSLWSVSLGSCVFPAQVCLSLQNVQSLVKHGGLDGKKLFIFWTLTGRTSCIRFRLCPWFWIAVPFQLQWTRSQCLS